MATIGADTSRSGLVVPKMGSKDVPLHKKKIGNELERMFSRKIVVYTAPKLDHQTSMFLLLKLILKAFVESLRKSVISSNGHTQVQVWISF